MELRDCIQKLETWVASLGDSPFRKKVQDFFLQEAEERGELTQTAIMAGVYYVVTLAT